MATIEVPPLVGVFENEFSAKKALEALRAAGFSDDQIGVATCEGGLQMYPLREILVAAGISEADAAMKKLTSLSRL